MDLSARNKPVAQSAQERRGKRRGSGGRRQTRPREAAFAAKREAVFDAARPWAVMQAQKQPPTPSTLSKQDGRSRDAERAREVEREQELPVEVVALPHETALAASSKRGIEKQMQREPWLHADGVPACPLFRFDKTWPACPIFRSSPSSRSAPVPDCFPLIQHSHAGVLAI